MPETFPSIQPTKARKKIDPRERRVDFGDGYTQRSGDGINLNRDQWNLTFVSDVADIDTIETFLKARGSHEAFYWTPPRAQSSDGTNLYTCKSWNRDYGIGPDVDQLTTIFIREFDS